MSWRRGQAYAQDLRDRVLAAAGSAQAVAERFGVSAAYVARAKLKVKRLGNAAPGAQLNHMPRKLAGLDGAIEARVAADTHITTDALRAWVSAEHGVGVSHATMHKALVRLGLTRKKRRSTPASNSAPT